jgi:hypothetical protein
MWSASIVNNYMPRVQWVHVGGLVPSGLGRPATKRGQDLGRWLTIPAPGAHVGRYMTHNHTQLHTT